MSTSPMMSIAAAKSALNNITANVNTGGTGTLKIRTGSIEASTTTADAGTLLSTLTMNATAFANATNATSNGLATATANSITSDTNAAATGTAGHFRIENGSGTVIFQGTCGTSAADLVMNTTSISAGDTVACTSFLVTLPCGDGVS